MVQYFVVNLSFRPFGFWQNKTAVIFLCLQAAFLASGQMPKPVGLLCLRFTPLFYLKLLAYLQALGAFNIVPLHDV